MHKLMIMYIWVFQFKQCNVHKWKLKCNSHDSTDGIVYIMTRVKTYNHQAFQHFHQMPQLLCLAMAH